MGYAIDHRFSGSSGDGLSKELWHACAGPLVTVPCQGERVYYFPQGHMEQVIISFSCDNFSKIYIFFCLILQRFIIMHV